MENNENPESSSKSREQADSTNTGNVVDMMLGKSSEKSISCMIFSVNRPFLCCINVTL